MKNESADKMIEITFNGFFVVLAIAVLVALFIGFYRTQNEAEVKERPVKQSQPYGIDVVTVDSCHYLTWQYGPFNAPAVAMVHKANCPNHGGKR